MHFGAATPAGHADPLVMGNGRDLIDMICKGFESPDFSDEEEQYNYSEQPLPLECMPSSLHSGPHTMLLHAVILVLCIGGFRVAVLRKGSVCVSAATIRCAEPEQAHSLWPCQLQPSSHGNQCCAGRVFGTNFAEMPFVATRDGYRREGNMRRLVQVVSHHLLPACYGVTRDAHAML